MKKILNAFKMCLLDKLLRNLCDGCDCRDCKASLKNDFIALSHKPECAQWHVIEQALDVWVSKEDIFKQPDQKATDAGNK